MITIRNRKGNETLIFAQTLEPETLEQLERLCNFEPYLDARIRVMPDAHAGKGCTVGTTMTITNRLTPNLVGVDIGCGVLTIRLGGGKVNHAQLDELIRNHIPHGFDVHKQPVRGFDFNSLRCARHVDLARAALSIGTLGGGNHFIELGALEGSHDNYLVIHSGSRKLGGDVCKHYQDKAIANMGLQSKRGTKPLRRAKSPHRAKGESEVNDGTAEAMPHRDMAYLEGQDLADYMNDMAIAQRFATENRCAMAEIILKGMGLKEVSRFETIHNYIDFRRMILRKGAVSAEKGQKLLIPINMRDGSLLCVGRGNENWNFSAPHGAGRLMSRNKAKEALNMNEFIASMRGIYTTSVSRATLDEAPQAYKPIDEIRRTITDTVEIRGTIRPIYNFKAH